MTKTLQISVSIVYSPIDKIDDEVYDIVHRKEAIKIASEEIERRIEKNIPEFSGCAVLISNKTK